MTHRATFNLFWQNCIAIKPAYLFLIFSQIHQFENFTYQLKRTLISLSSFQSGIHFFAAHQRKSRQPKKPKLLPPGWTVIHARDSQERLIEKFVGCLLFHNPPSQRYVMWAENGKTLINPLIFKIRYFLPLFLSSASSKPMFIFLFLSRVGGKWVF